MIFWFYYSSGFEYFVTLMNYVVPFGSDGYEKEYFKMGN